MPKLSESAFAPRVETSFVDSEEDAFSGDALYLAKILKVYWKLDCGVETLLPKVVFFDNSMNFFLVYR